MTIYRKIQIGMLVSASVGVPALAASSAMRSYEAKYEGYCGSNKSSYACDGNDRVCITTTDQREILDFKNNKCFFIDDKKKVVTERPLLPTDSDVMVTAEPPHTWKKVGKETVQNHSCQKYQGARSVVWIATDINRVARLVEVDHIVMTVTNLKSYSATEPSAELFDIPSGYSVRHSAAR